MLQKLICLSFLISLFVVMGCVSVENRQEDLKQERDTVSVMAYNVEDMFDAVQDDHPFDDSFLPIEEKRSKRFRAKCMKLDFYSDVKSCLNKNWTQAIVESKLSRVADVILQVESGLRKGADIVVLVEVENGAVLSKLKSSYLSDSHYVVDVFGESTTHSFIDIGILSRYEMIGLPRRHTLPGSDSEVADLRGGILEVTLSLPNNEALTVLGVHFPDKNRSVQYRKDAIRKLDEIRSGFPTGRKIIVAGDFNISSGEEAQHLLFQDVLSENWIVSHLVGCVGCKGTYYFPYKGNWSFQDALLFSKNFLQSSRLSWRLKRDSLKVLTGSQFQVNRAFRPARFIPDSPKGVSDHWPIYAEIELDR